MRIAIAGATGAVGRHVTDVARQRQHTTVSLSRSAGIDLFNLAAVSRALEGVDAVIDVASVPTTSGVVSKRFYRSTTTNLLSAGVKTGVSHHVVLSIVNVDRASTGYYAGKLLQEHLVERGALPWTILRATQFHEFAGQMLERAKIGPLCAIPIMRTQPVAAREVAVRLVELAESGAVGHDRDLAGPREERLVELARAYAAATGLHGSIVSIPLPGSMGTAMRNGTLLPGADARLSAITFTEWLQAQHPRPPRSW